MTWSLGGTTGSYDGEIRQVEPDLQPDEPPELDLILEEMCPNMTFMQYKTITREVWQSGTTYHSDYYGGSTTEAYRGFNVKKLYDVLLERGMLHTVK